MSEAPFPLIGLIEKAIVRVFSNKWNTLKKYQEKN